MKIKYNPEKPNEWRDALIHEPDKPCWCIALLQGCDTGTIIKENIYYRSPDDGFMADEHTKISNAWNILVWRFDTIKINMED